jgi:hypothetical protein
MNLSLNKTDDSYFKESAEYSKLEILSVDDLSDPKIKHLVSNRLAKQVEEDWQRSIPNINNNNLTKIALSFLSQEEIENVFQAEIEKLMQESYKLLLDNLTEEKYHSYYSEHQRLGDLIRKFHISENKLQEIMTDVFTRIPKDTFLEQNLIDPAIIEKLKEDPIVLQNRIKLVTKNYFGNVKEPQLHAFKQSLEKFMLPLLSQEKIIEDYYGGNGDKLNLKTLGELVKVFPQYEDKVDELVLKLKILPLKY